MKKIYITFLLFVVAVMSFLFYRCVIRSLLASRVRCWRSTGRWLLNIATT